MAPVSPLANCKERIEFFEKLTEVKFNSPFGASGMISDFPICDLAVAIAPERSPAP